MLVGGSVASSICGSRHVSKEDEEGREGEFGHRLWCTGGVFIRTAAVSSVCVRFRGKKIVH